MTLAVVHDEVGGPNVLRVVDLPDPEPAEGGVVVRVLAAGINPFDAKAREGRIPFIEAPFPRGVGTDFAGEVVACGPSARYVDGRPVRAGDEVLGWVELASLRQLLAVPAGQLVPKPAGMSWEVAGSLATAGLAADAAVRRLDLGADDTVLISAAAGSVGVLASQMSLALGARVIGTASTANHEFLAGLGVVPVRYGPGLEARVRAAAPDGVTAVEDNAGRETIEAALSLGVPASRICTIVDHAAVTDLGLGGLGRYARDVHRLQEVAQRVVDDSWKHPVGAIYALSDTRDAFRALDAPRSLGKIVIAPQK